MSGQSSKTVHSESVCNKQKEMVKSQCRRYSSSASCFHPQVWMTSKIQRQLLQERRNHEQKELWVSRRSLAYGDTQDCSHSVRAIGIASFHRDHTWTDHSPILSIQLPNLTGFGHLHSISVFRQEIVLWISKIFGLLFVWCNSWSKEVSPGGLWAS